MYQTDPVTVVMCESSEIVCKGLEHVLSSEPNIKLVGFIRRADTAIEEITRLSPAVVILDIDFPGCSIEEIVDALRLSPACPRLILMKDPYSRTALTPDVWGCVNGICSKCILPHQLIRAISAVASGAAWLDGDIARQILQVLPARSSAAAGFRLPTEPGTAQAV